MHYTTVRQFARNMRKNQTPAEARFWEKVRNRRFMGLKINRQFVIEFSKRPGHKAYFIPDFHCFQKKVLVEIDGGYHNRKEQVDYDRSREDILRGLGYRIIRFTNAEVMYHWEDVAEQLKGFLEGE